MKGECIMRKHAAIFIAAAAITVWPALSIAQTAPPTSQPNPPTSQPPATPTPQPRPGTAQPPTTTPSTAAGQKSSNPDAKFAMEAANGGLAEVEHGKLASAHASNDDVKKFGDRMVDDHGKANDELASILKQKGMNPPTSLEGKHKSLEDRLSKLNGPAFDKAYIAAMVKDHTEDVKEFEKESKDGKDPELKAFAAKTLPIIQDHLKMAKDIQAKLGGGTE
jgi:putative membrane protein